MNTFTTHEKQAHAQEEIIFNEAMDWLFYLNKADPEAPDPHPDLAARNAALFKWLKTSPIHLRIFWEELDMEQRIRGLDPAVVADIRHLIDSQSASRLHAGLSKWLSLRKWLTPVSAIGASSVVLIWIASYFLNKPEIYSTRGKSQKLTLRDGSIVDLNINSQMAVVYSRDIRGVRLLRGEAFFEVSHDLHRPFTVSSEEASVIAVGTQFDVRKSAHALEVAVISGSVQARALSVGSESAQSSLLLTDGEVAEIASGTVIKKNGLNAKDIVSWRNNHLEFHRVRLADVAAEFNRYNVSQIRVEGATAQETLVTGTFKMDGNQAVIDIAQDRNLSVTREGDNWIIQ